MSAATELAAKKCVPSPKGASPLQGLELKRLSALVPGWRIVDEHRLLREFKFPDFKTALAFTNRVGVLADEQDHHPDIALSYGKVGVTLWTHTVSGLSESDFVMAAKIERLPGAEA